MSIDNVIPTKSDSMKVQVPWARASTYSLVGVDEFQLQTWSEVDFCTCRIRLKIHDKKFIDVTGPACVGHKSSEEGDANDLCIVFGSSFHWYSMQPQSP